MRPRWTADPISAAKAALLQDDLVDLPQHANRSRTSQFNGQHHVMQSTQQLKHDCAAVFRQFISAFKEIQNFASNPQSICYSYEGFINAPARRNVVHASLREINLISYQLQLSQGIFITGAAHFRNSSCGGSLTRSPICQNSAKFIK
jgi:hypothetical protein